MPEPIKKEGEVVVEQKPVEEVKPPVVEVDTLAAKDAEIAKLIEERDNYKNVALKRLGKLPGDVDFGKDDQGLTVEEQVRNTLIEREIAKKQQEKDDEVKKVLRENAELKLALKNRPGSGSTGGNDGGSTIEVKDNVFSEAQLAALTARATRLKVDPAKFIENAKKNFAARR